MKRGSSSQRWIQFPIQYTPTAHKKRLVDIDITSGEGGSWLEVERFGGDLNRWIMVSWWTLLIDDEEYTNPLRKHCSRISLVPVQIQSHSEQYFSEKHTGYPAQTLVVTLRTFWTSSNMGVCRRMHDRPVGDSSVLSANRSPIDSI